MQNVSPEDLLAGLNPDQAEAATIFDRPALVLAGSGTGKTHILATKFMLGLARGIPADRIMAVTFSRRAAKELRDRIEPQLDPAIDPATLWIGTFHAISTRILRQNPALSPIGSEFTTLEDAEIDMILGQALRQMKHPSLQSDREYKRKVKELKGQIDKLKNEGLDIAGPEVLGRVDRETASLMQAYQRFLRERGNADFGDLIVGVLMMMKNPAAARAWSNRWDLILVDEYQDINTGQGAWIEALTGPNTALTAFGDDDQVIYQWRGANPSYIRQFGSRYPEARVITLRTNYRSPKPIVEAATNMIRNNVGRYDKDVVSAHENQTDARGAITVHAHPYHERHSRIIGVLTAESLAFDWKDMMILTRVNAEAAEIATKLKDAGIPANLVKPSANDAPLMRHLSSWLRITRNPHDAAALASLLETTDDDPVFQNIWTSSMLKGVDLVETVRGQIAAGRLATPNYREFLDRYDAVQAGLAGLEPIQALHMLFEESGLIKRLGAVEEAERLHFIALFQSLCAEAANADSLHSMEDLIQSQIPNRAVNNGVMISTMHGVKGLEAPLVFATSWSSGVFPRSIHDRDLEEQRRLAFVTVTRAKQRLHLFYDTSKGISQFIKELRI